MDIFVFDKYGYLIRSESTKVDRVYVKYENSDFVMSKSMPKGTISMNRRVSKSGKSFGYLEIKGDNNGREVFKTLACGTKVEFTLMQTGEFGDQGRNLITTSNDQIGEENAKYVMNEVIGANEKLRNHIHNHPSGALSPSMEDIEVAKQVEKKFPGVVMSIYSAIANELLGNEVEYNSNTKVIELDEYIFNNLMEIDRKAGRL